jgi:hypothetical protein
MKDLDRFDEDFVRASKCPLTRPDTIEKLDRVRVSGMISVLGFAFVAFIGPAVGFDISGNPMFLGIVMIGAIMGMGADIKIKVLKCLSARDKTEEA